MLASLKMAPIRLGVILFVIGTHMNKCVRAFRERQQRVSLSGSKLRPDPQLVPLFVLSSMELSNEPENIPENTLEELVKIRNYNMSTEIEGKALCTGPQPNVSYPLSVLYCGNCSMPIEYCEYYPEYDKCKQWLEKNLPTEFEKIYHLSFRFCSGDKEDGDGAGAEEEKKRQKRGGKGMMKTKKKEDGPKQVYVSRAPRGKKKSVTVVTGLSSFDIDLKVAAKFFGTKFACGSSVTGDDEIVIQGDVKDDLFDIIPEKWPDIDEDFIEDLGDQKR
uniref:Density-regulated protein n=1 Tax=Timema bartmani TaxID=61472 RepID=A0A7R9HW44_9NEOP|nr:unnamed protein product [Timema bartmani]